MSMSDAASTITASAVGSATAPGAAALHAHAKTAKQLYAAQLTRLVEKSEEDAALLDQMREFAKKALEIERDAGERLERLSKSYAKVVAKAQGPSALTKSSDAASDMSSAGAFRQRATAKAFALLVTETEKRARRGIDMADVLSKDVIDPLSLFLKEKATATTKYADHWRGTQDTVVSALIALDTARREYEEAVKAHELAVKKHADHLAGKTGVLKSVKQAFSSLTDEERTEKLAAKVSATRRRRLDTRNALVLAHAASNAAQPPYWDTDLPAFMKTLDGTFHTTFARALGKHAGAMVTYLESARAGMATVASATDEIDRDAEAAAYLKDHDREFPGASLFTIEPLGDDEVKWDGQSLDVEEAGTKAALAQKLAELMKRRQIVAKELDQTHKEISGLEQMAKVYEKNPEFGNATNPLDTKLNLEMAVVSLGTQLRQIEAQIAVLEKHDISISSIASVQIMSTSISAETLENATLVSAGGASAGSASRRVSTALSKSGSMSSLGSGPTSPRLAKVNGLPPVPPVPKGLGKAEVLYGYQAQGDGELTIEAGQTVVVLEADKDGWTKAELDGAIGFVPSNYITSPQPEFAASAPARITSPPIPRRTAPATTSGDSLPRTPTTAARPVGTQSLGTVTALFDHTPQEPGELAFQAGDAIEVLDRGTPTAGTSDPAEWWRGRNMRSRAMGLFPYIFTQGWEAVLATPAAPADTPLARPAAGAASRRATVVRPRSAAVPEDRVVAQFEYAAAVEGELSMSAGDVIVVRNRNTGSDAWWEGKNTRTGQVGQFPKDYTAPV
ncbi:F-BAR and double SH3 domains protein 1 [Allomyces arbusculus]|nr:F-BAR and double SH3 domains protein 1 [Allomyces arbusculus]